MTPITPFNSQHLEAVCRVLADTERGLTGTQIERLLQEIGVIDVSPNMTKWKRLFNALAEAQYKHEVGNHLIMLINRAMDPVNYARDSGAFNWRRDELNVVLAFSGFNVREDGKVAHADKATTLDAARARAGRLKATLKSRNVHVEVLKYCRAEPVNKAFSIRNPLLVLGPLTTESEKSEHKGFAHLMVGLFGAVRNPLAHAPKTTWPMSEEDALDILTLISFIHRKLDRAYKFPTT